MMGIPNILPPWGWAVLRWPWLVWEGLICNRASNKIP